MSLVTFTDPRFQALCDTAEYLGYALHMRVQTRPDLEVIYELARAGNTIDLKSMDEVAAALDAIELHIKALAYETGTARAAAACSDLGDGQHVHVTPDGEWRPGPPPPPQRPACCLGEQDLVAHIPGKGPDGVTTYAMRRCPGCATATLVPLPRATTDGVGAADSVPPSDGATTDGVV